jgi:DNA-directed RNA polymerase specialized sigma24 family protein
MKKQGKKSPRRRYTQNAQPETASFFRRSPSYATVPVIEIPFLEAAHDICDPSQNPESDAVASKRRGLLARIMSELEPAERALIVSRFVLNETLAVIAEREGVSKKTIFGRIAKILPVIKRKLAERGVRKFEDLV